MNDLLQIEEYIRHRPYPSQFDRMVENPTVFSFDRTELAIYETLEPESGIVSKFHSTTVAIVQSGNKHIELANHTFNLQVGDVLVLAPGTELGVSIQHASVFCPCISLSCTIPKENILKQGDKIVKQHPSPSHVDSITYVYQGKDFLLFRESKIYQLIQRLMELAMEPNQSNAYFVELALDELTVRLLQTQARRLLLKSTGAPVLPENFMSAIEYIDANYTETISIETLCSIACVSKTVLFKKFKDTFGATPVEYILKRKIESAVSMLLYKPLHSVKQIAMECGFNSESYFNYVFKKRTGTTPVVYRTKVSSAAKLFSD